MIAKTLKKHPLPGGFSAMVQKLVLLPREEPEIQITRAKPRGGSIQWREDHGFFAPLVKGGEALVSWYDWPERQLTGTACARVLGRVRMSGANCYRVRIPDFDLDQRWTYDHEWYWAVEGGRIYFVGKSNFEPGADHPRLMTWEDPD
jgi:hypothetical protein